MHTYSLVQVAKMTRNQDASRDEKENENEINLNSNRTLYSTLLDPSDTHPLYTPLLIILALYTVYHILHTSRLKDFTNTSNIRTPNRRDFHSGPQ